MSDTHDELLEAIEKVENLAVRQWMEVGNETQKLRDEIEQLTKRVEEMQHLLGKQKTEIEQLKEVEKAAMDLFHWHAMVEGGIVPGDAKAWQALGNALFPVDQPVPADLCHHEPGVDCPVHPMTEENQIPVSAEVAAEIDRSVLTKVSHTVELPSKVSDGDALVFLDGNGRVTESRVVTDKGCDHPQSTKFRDGWRCDYCDELTEQDTNQ